MKKRLTALILAFCLILPLCIPCFAESDYCLHENAQWYNTYPRTLITDSRYTRECPDCGMKQTAKTARTSIAEYIFDAFSRLFFLTDKPALSEDFTVTAHTGPGIIKMNSMTSLRYSLRSGADIVELDLDLNSDGVAVMAHGEPDKARATLEDGFALIAKYRDIKVNVDVKNRNAVPQAQKLAIKYGILDRIFYTGLGEDGVTFVKENSPLVPCYLNSTPSSDPSECERLCEKAVSLGAIGLNFSYHDYSPEIAAAAHAHGLLLSVYTVNSIRDLRMCLKYDIDNITTEYPYMLYTMTGRFMYTSAE